MSPRELAGALYGLGLLLRFDGRAWEFFDKSLRGFWLSYLAALIVAPFHFTHMALAYQQTPDGLGPVPYAIVQVLTYILTWTLFPFAMMYVSQILARGGRYFWQMVPYNWFQLPVALSLAAVGLLNDVGIIPLDAYRLVSLIAMVIVAVYTTFIGAVGLRIPIGTAMSLVVLDYALTFLAGALIARI
jgi:hypothetical protein